MLTLYTGQGDRDCDGLSRRDFLRVGTLGVGNLTLSGLLAAKALARSSGQNFVREKAVVLLYLSGGASHIETFNPNMDAPAPYRSLTGEVKTSVPGVTFGGTFPQLGKLAHKMAVVRSFSHGVGNHEAAHVHVLSGGTDSRGNGKEGYSIGSLYARLRGTNHPATGMPTFALLTHPEIDGQYRKELGRVIKGSSPGTLGPRYAPFHHTGEETQEEAGRKSGSRKENRRGGGRTGTGSFADDMKLNVPVERLDARRALLEALDRLRGQIETENQYRATQTCQEQAFDLLLGSAAEAFDISAEKPSLVERYDTSKIQIGHKRFRSSTLGKQMLMARRLCEAGCGFVTVQSAGWDMHADGNNPGIVKGMNMLGSTVDKAVSAFLEDLEARGLEDRILLVITGDFGRTPNVNRRGGRDHWASLGTLAFAGGGLMMGQAIGRSDHRNGKPATEPITPRHMMNTILHALFDIGKLRVTAGLPRDLLALIEKAEPIRELV